MGDSLDAINFKIDPVVIPSTAITKLDPYPYSSGGIAEIWRCTILSELGTFKVAVKSFRLFVVGQELHRAIRMLRREAYVWITLKHDHILPLEGITDGFGKIPALVSPWMDNGALSNYLKHDFSALSEGRKLELVRQVADGLGYLHGQGVVHGNLTGTNTLVDASGNIRIAGFGSSIIIAEAKDAIFDSVQWGNSRWMAPEFLDYSESDDSESPLKPTKQGDIYSFGCVMLQIFSGKEPYAQIRDAKNVIRAIIHGREPFQGTKITMENDYKELSSQCLSREPGGRPTIVKIISIIGSVAYKSITNVSSAQPELNVVPLQDLTEFIFKTGDYPIACSGFGDIWKCIYRTGGGQIIVAVKSQRLSNISGEAEKTSRRIRREINVRAGIKHRNIMPLLGYTMGFGPLMAIVTPWAENGSLTTYLTKREDASLSVTRQFEILRDVADGLQYLHACNVIHGNLTGPNVLIHSDGTACLSDFSLSLRDYETDWTTQLYGSFPWLAPELLTPPDDDIPVRPSKSSDIYAFGGTMLEVLTSKIPYYYLSQTSIISSIIRGKKPDRSRYPSFSDKYWYIIEECWSAVETRPSAEKIFQVIRDELKSLLSNEPEGRSASVEIIHTTRRRIGNESIIDPRDIRQVPVAERDAVPYDARRVSSTQAETDEGVSTFDTENKRGNRPILKPKNSFVSTPHDAPLIINMYEVEDLGPATYDSISGSGPLLECMKDDGFDFEALSSFLSSADTPCLQRAALQLLEYAAKSQCTKFTTCESIILHPIAELVLESRDFQVRCAALDTLQLFLNAPHAIDIVKSEKFRGVVTAIANDIVSREPVVQEAAMDLLEVVSQSEEILAEFAVAISRVSSVLASMPTATQITALKILEISAGSNIHEIVAAVAHTFHYVIQPIYSPETCIRIAALRVLKAGVGTKDPDLARAAKTISLVVKKLHLSGETDEQGTAKQAPEADIRNNLRASWSVGQESDMIVDSINELGIPVDFQPIVIPSAAIKKSESYPQFSGAFNDIWKCSISAASGMYRHVAIKSFRNFPVDDRKLLHERIMGFCREVYLWSDMSHDHILSLEGIITSDDFGPLPALVSSWMENGSLTVYLKWSFSQLPNGQKSKLVQQVAAGLSYLHEEKNIVHGDLTGSNILVDGSGNVHIADFGISILVAEAENAMSSPPRMGYTRWTAPEFIMVNSDQQQQLPTKAGDIYSFGCVMLQIFSGEIPYPQMKSPMDVFRVKMAGQEPFIGVKINMDEIYRVLSSQCLARDPEKRPLIFEITTAMLSSVIE